MRVEHGEAIALRAPHALDGEQAAGADAGHMPAAQEDDRDATGAVDEDQLEAGYVGPRPHPQGADPALDLDPLAEPHLADGRALVGVEQPGGKLDIVARRPSGIDRLRRRGATSVGVARRFALRRWVNGGEWHAGTPLAPRWCRSGTARTSRWRGATWRRLSRSRPPCGRAGGGARNAGTRGAG